MATEAQKKAAAKYNSAMIKQLKLNLNKKTDKDIISILEAKPNKQGYIKALIRKDNS